MNARSLIGLEVDPCGSPLSTQEKRDAVAQIKSHIIRYRASIEALEEQQRELEASLSLVLYPVLTLPIEITSRIFVHCLPGHRRVRPSRSTAPLILAQICRHWRDVALSTCELWSSIYFDNPLSFDSTSVALGRPIVPRDSGARALLQTWLSRAKAHPISLGLNHEFRVVPPALVSLVSAFSGQIQDLDLHLFPEQFDRLQPFHVAFPRLLHLATQHSSENDLRHLLANAPSLRELRLLGKDFSLNFSLPLLTHLEISEEISSRTFLDILAKFPLLEHLNFSLRDSEVHTIPQISIPTVGIFPRLSSLATCSNGTYALHLVSFPNLTKLKLPSFAEPTAVFPFHSRSACTIEHLVLPLTGCDEEPEEVATWLKEFPSVAVLIIPDCPDLNPLIEYLNSSSLPRLTDITILSTIGPNTAELDYDSVVEMLQDRRDPSRGVKLRKFHLK
ncbi:hypothetical protein B0H11DRAFT_2056944 [Mycena galericulata]|nr:hypothetical protein B0H11DRAFT_2056944 [Mycena galericulata]